MPRYSKKIQVLLTEKQFEDLGEIASQQKAKLGTLVRKAIEEQYLKNKKQREIAGAVDRLLSLPETPVPDNYQGWEDEYLKKMYSCR
jgi:hypothetical protein